MKTLTTVMLVLFAALARPVAAEDISWTLICKTDTVRDKVRASVEDYDLKIFDADYASRCPRMDPCEQPVDDSADTSREKIHTDWIYDALNSANGKYAVTTPMASDLKVWGSRRAHSTGGLGSTRSRRADFAFDRAADNLTLAAWRPAALAEPLSVFGHLGALA